MVLRQVQRTSTGLQEAGFVVGPRDIDLASQAVLTTPPGSKPGDRINLEAVSSVYSDPKIALALEAKSKEELRKMLEKKRIEQQIIEQQRFLENLGVTKNANEELSSDSSSEEEKKILKPK